MPARLDVADRSALIARWLDLTCTILPGMAAEHRWPIRADHCFMRVCLDVSLGEAWPSVVPAPAIRTMDVGQLQAAVALAESIVAAPDTLPSLNARSLAMRKAWRAAGSPRAR